MFQHSLIFSIVLFLSAAVFAQTDDYCIKLVNKSNTETVRTITEGKRIILVDATGNKVSGKVNLANDSLLTVADTSILISNVAVLRGKSTGITAVRIFGGAMGVFGLMMVGAGGTILMETMTDQSIGSIILIPLGLITAGTGVIATLAGISISFVNGKKYDLAKWEMTIVPISEVPAK